MNEKINKLWDQAWDDNTPLSIIKEKFAELIIRECANLHDMNSGYYDANNEWCAYYEVILKHFGIEESGIDTQLRNRSTYFGNNP